MAAALDTIGHGDPEHGRRRLILFGHSTGGLTLALWNSRHRGVAAGLVLNSPWLEFQATGFARELIAPLMKLGARRNPSHRSRPSTPASTPAPCRAGPTVAGPTTRPGVRSAVSRSTRGGSQRCSPVRTRSPTGSVPRPRRSCCSARTACCPRSGRRR
ncbi:serine aminopeptidase domain-containing protein [Sphingomonas sp. LR61]|uniref:serine aminopeptidase domain-containing protein n=1 Tax=Sphingomonas sp. LR61 TaxID=3050234 RepID=UPI003FA772C8